MRRILARSTARATASASSPSRSAAPLPSIRLPPLPPPQVVKDFPSTALSACCNVVALPVAPLPSDRANHTRKGGPSGSSRATGAAGVAPRSTPLSQGCKQFGAPAPGNGQAPPAGPSPFAYLPAV